MCLILFAVNPDERYQLIVAANRDELYARPTSAADFWADNEDVLAGKDLNMGGTWLGVNRQGRFSAVTNFREDPPDPIPPKSRGELPADFLAENPDPSAYLAQVAQHGQEYRGFNLIVSDQTGCWYYGNRVTGSVNPRKLVDGFYGLSNQVLDCDWPKVRQGREKLKQLLDDSSRDDLIEGLFGLLLYQGDGREFSNSFIAADTYGTRAATVVTVSHDGEVSFEERNFGESGIPGEINKYAFKSSA